MTIKLLTKPAAGVRLDVERCMQALRDIDEDVSDQFLENTVFTRKNVVRDLPHSVLASLAPP